MFFVFSDYTCRMSETAAGQRDTLLRTGEAAELLGCTRQHVVDLCDRGVLPFSRVGSHRRVRLEDVMQIAAGATPGSLRRDQERNLWLHAAVAGVLVSEPDIVVQRAKANLDRLIADHPRGQARRRLDEWQRILHGPITAIVAVLTSPSERSIELRQNSPFAGVLEPERRRAILTAFREHWSDNAA